ncbi:MAG: hypothetical protein JWO98_1988 [Frankiales bacterium]|nr:hypothetical protein [Frankiales bacterium]
MRQSEAGRSGRELALTGKVAMSKWNDRVQGHAVQGTFTSLLVNLENLSADRIAQAPEDIDRLLWVVNHARDRLRGAPAVAVPQQTLDQLNQQLVQITSEVSNFTGNGNVAHLANANTYADTVLELVRVLPPLSADAAETSAATDVNRVHELVSHVTGSTEAELSRLRAAAQTLGQNITETQERFTHEVNSASQQFGEVRAAVDAQSRRLEEALATQQGQFAQTQTERATALDEQMRRLDQALAAQQAQFAQTQTERATAFDQVERDRAETMKTAVKTAEEMFTATDARLQQQGADTLRLIEERKTQADELLGAIGMAGVAAGYNETAKNEKLVADKLRLGTIMVAVVAACVLGSTLFIDHTAAGSWQRLVARVVVSLSLGGLAAYFGRQSAEHRKVERDARVRQLQLAALNPYLANMPDEEIVRLKAELAPGWFGPVAEPSNGGGEGNDSNGLPSAAQLIEVLKIITTKGGST